MTPESKKEMRRLQACKDATTEADIYETVLARYRWRAGKGPRPEFGPEDLFTYPLDDLDHLDDLLGSLGKQAVARGHVGPYQINRNTAESQMLCCGKDLLSGASRECTAGSR